MPFVVFCTAIPLENYKKIYKKGNNASDLTQNYELLHEAKHATHIWLFPIYLQYVTLLLSSYLLQTQTMFEQPHVYLILRGSI